MQTSKFALSLALIAMLPACGGGGGSGGGSPAPSPSPSPTPTTSTCSFANRATFVRDVLNEWYLFPELLDTSPNPANFTNLDDYIDALVAPARAQEKDRYFTYITSIAEENAFFSGGTSAGFGFRLGYDTANNRVGVIETFEDTPALTANIDRGSELIGIGTTASNIVTVASMMASGGPQAVIDALGTSDPGVVRVIRVRDQLGVTRDVSLTKAEFALDPVSNRYGAKVILDGTKKVGYINLRTYIDPANADLRAAFADFKAQGVTELVIDQRYNGGGALSVAEVFGNLMAGNLNNQVYYQLVLRPSKAAENEIYRFVTEANAIAPTKIAFIGTGSTASASELLINGMQPYLGTNIALVGSNTFGKPVGQFAFDRAACDDRLRAMTFKIANSQGNGEYFRGLATTVPNTCRAVDNISYQLGDPREAMVATALDFLAGRSCTAIAGGGITTQRVTEGIEVFGLPANPSVAQREVPGLN